MDRDCRKSTYRFYGANAFFSLSNVPDRRLLLFVRCFFLRAIYFVKLSYDTYVGATYRKSKYRINPLWIRITLYIHMCQWNNQITPLSDYGSAVRIYFCRRRNLISYRSYATRWKSGKGQTGLGRVKLTRSSLEKHERICIEAETLSRFTFHLRVGAFF